MSGTATADLAAAVSNAGGLGTIGGITNGGADWLSTEIQRCRRLTDAPFSINLWLHIDHALPPYIDACLAEGVHSVTLSFGDPTPQVAPLQDAGIIVIHQAQTLAGVQQAIAAGVDVVIAQGGEGGGHTGQLSTIAFLPQAVDAADGTPVLAAGGIADGRGLAAALALGAQGVVLGTAMIAAAEANMGDATHRERVLAATVDDTQYTEVHDIAQQRRWPPGIGGRTIVTPFTEKWHGREAELREKRESAVDEPGARDDRDPTPAYAGQAAGLVHEVEPAAAIVERIVLQAEDALRRASHHVD